ncbi:MAG: TatD family hydrolase, partial [candidate division Zixibacteria bacterium]|nr:TatD family hydrolase [candidate division Zixibacteria bacterium]
MIDSHCHIDFRDFDGIRDDALKEAQDAGVHTIVNVGADVESSERGVTLAQRHKMVFATVGVHPHDAKSLDDRAFNRLRELAQQDKVVAIGEVGLDFYRDLSPRPAQKIAFHKQMQLAVELKLPVVIHTREAFQETLLIAAEYADLLPGGVFHCFPGDVNEALEVFKLGFVIGVGGVVTYDKSRMSRVAAAIPLDKMILETDAPYLTPVPHRGKKNRPAYV